MGTMAGAVASKAFIEANGKKVGTPEVGIVGTGPYKFVSWTKGQEIVLDRFDDYWNTERARAVKRFVVKIILDEATIVQALTTGEVDGVFGTALSGKSVRRSPRSTASRSSGLPPTKSTIWPSTPRKSRSTTRAFARRSRTRSTRRAC